MVRRFAIRPPLETSPDREILVMSPRFFDGRRPRHCPGGIALSHWPGEGTGPQGATTIIHGTPKRSATMPKREEKKVFVIGIRTCPPSDRDANSRSASASSGAVSDSEKP